jgi:hypothetical protein
MPSAPHIAKSSSAVINVSEDINAGAGSGEVVALTGNDHSHLEAQVQAAFLKGMRELMGKSEDVGAAFAEEVRKIHYKEAPERSIRGQTTLDEAESLREEGIEVLAVPIIPAFKNTLQ